MSTATYLTGDGRKLTVNIDPVPGISKPWALVANPGTDDEFVWTEFSSFGEALRMKRNHKFDGDLMKRLADGSLTTEF